MFTRSTAWLMGVLSASIISGISSELHAAGNSRAGYYVSNNGTGGGYWEGPYTSLAQAASKLDEICKKKGSKPVWQHTTTGKLANSGSAIKSWNCPSLPPSVKPTPPPPPKPVPPPPPKVTPKPEPLELCSVYLRIGTNKYNTTPLAQFTGTRQQILKYLEDYLAVSPYSRNQLYIPTPIRLN